LQLVDDAPQIRNQVVEAIGVVELPTDFDLPGAGRAHFMHRAADVIALVIASPKCAGVG
jgi:hypothetical protein